MKKVVFISRLLNDKNAAGIHRYTLEVLRELDKIVPDNQVMLLISPDEEDTFGFKHISVVKIGKVYSIGGSIGRRITWYLYKNYYAYKYIRKTHAISVDLLLQFPLFGCDVIAIYDCRVNKFPEFYSFSKNQRRTRKRLLKHQNGAVKKSKRIITDSQSAEQELLEVYPGLGKPTDVIYCGWQHFLNVEYDDSILERLNLCDRSFFLSLGSRLPHKNIKWINCAARKHPQHIFVVTGKDMGDTDIEREMQKNLILAGRLSDGEIKSLMRHCRAFIQPSLYEGFGLPPLEAMSVGANCVVSDIPVFREIYEDSVWYIDPRDYENIDLDRVLSEEKTGNEKVLRKFSWKMSAKKLWDILSEIATD